MQTFLSPAGSSARVPFTPTSFEQASGATAFGSGASNLAEEWLHRIRRSIDASGMDDAAKLYAYTRLLKLVAVPPNQLWRHSLDAGLLTKLLDSHHAVRALEKTLGQMIGPELLNEPGVAEDMRSVIVQLAAKLDPQKKQASETVEAELTDMKQKYYQSEDDAV